MRHHFLTLSSLGQFGGVRTQDHLDNMVMVGWKMESNPDGDWNCSVGHGFKAFDREKEEWNLVIFGRQNRVNHRTLG